ncbi:immunoglobulin superfamily member 5 [Scleropages formosus]|uniref:immunoglobulin superfamily member 5 n=1 Tax=Scleropages formosus TaxID=113540 RepID=UPI0010FA9319|nr:immunoglobulin superfamily member 5-like [Scleropages formosus]
MTQPILHCLLLLHAARGLMAQVQLWPMNATVLLGTNATFNCSVQQQWVAMAWLLKSDVVLIITRDHGPAINNLRYTAQNYSTAQESTWAFTVIGVRQNDTGPVSCDVQNIQKQTAFLDVQESGTVAILGGNVTATQGDLAYFQCQALGWRPAPTVSWTVEGRAVNADSYNVSSVDWGNLFNTTSTLGVVANNSAPVVCRASVSTMPAPLTGTAFMSVGERFPLQTHRAALIAQEPMGVRVEANRIQGREPSGVHWRYGHRVAKPSQRSQTVLIAVTVSIVLLVVIVIVIIIIVVFCCKRRNAKKSSYQDEMRKTRSQTEERQNSPGKQGMDNLGYATDNHSGVVHGQYSDSGFSQPSSTNTPQTPSTSCVHASNAPGLVCTHHSALKKYRQATIV